MKISTNFQDPLIKIVPDSLVVKKMKGRPKNVKVRNNVTTTLQIQFPQAKCVQLATP